MTIQSFNAADGYIDFVYDGHEIVERIAGQRSAGVGLLADDWFGYYPFKIFSDAGWRATLVNFMGEPAYRRAGDTIDAATPMHDRDYGSSGADAEIASVTSRMAPWRCIMPGGC